MKKKEELSFARAFSLSDQKAARLICGYSLPSKRISLKIARYFFLDDKYILNDDIELPPIDQLTIDEDLASLQRNDIQNVINRNKNKHYISHSFQLLGYPKRVKVFISLLLTTIPLIAYTGFCANTIISNRFDTMSSYKNDDGEEFPISDLENMPSNEKHVDVKIGF